MEKGVELMAKRVNAKISDRANEWLDKKAEEMGVTKSALISFAVESYIKETDVVHGIPKLIQELEKNGVKVKL